MATLPIRIREVVRADGSRTRSLFVFCPRESASITPELCARCGFRCPPENEALAPAVGCEAATERDPAEGGGAGGFLYGPGALAARVSAGAASAQIIVCVQADVPLGTVHRVMGASPRWLAYPVVDESGVLLGSVPGSAVASAGGDRRAAFLPTADVMVPALAVRESDHVDEAIGKMTGHHLRYVLIVDDAGRVTGLLSDLDVLHWIARGAPVRWR